MRGGAVQPQPVDDAQANILNTNVQAGNHPMLYCKLPSDVANRHCLLMDSILSSGYTVVRAIEVLLVRPPPLLLPPPSTRRPASFPFLRRCNCFALLEDACTFWRPAPAPAPGAGQICRPERAHTRSSVTGIGSTLFFSLII